MKKSLLTLALMTVVSLSASAVAITWKSDGMSFEGTALKNNTAISAYLVYLASGDYASSYDITPTFAATDIGSVVSFDTDGSSKGAIMTTKFNFTFGDYQNGDAFGLLVSYYDATTQKTWFNLSQNKNVIAGLQNEISTVTFDTFTFNMDKADPLNKLTAGGGWASVPEPATGALALAGLALLFRRKKA